MATIRNQHHEVRIEAESLPGDRVQVREVRGREAISQLFSFEVELVMVDGAELDPEAVIGEEVTLVFLLVSQAGETELRRIYGMIAALEAPLDPLAPQRLYRLHVVPRAHRLTLVETQEIFMHKSVPEIIQEKLARVCLATNDVEMRLLATYPRLEFVVQYKETDLAFISRLAEHLGISFFFEHASGTDKMIFTDHNDGFRDIEGTPLVPFRSRGEEADVYHIELIARMIPKLYLQQDYNYEAPRLSLTAMDRAPSGYAGGVVEYGAHYRTPEEGADLARIRAEERQATHKVYSGKSDTTCLSAGAIFELEGNPWVGGKLLVVEVEHHAKQVVLAHGGTGEERNYTNTFRVIDAKTPYRPPRRTPKPRILGFLPGLVEPLPDGDIGRYARLDSMGRYTVRLYFDTSAEGTRQFSSLPVRMMQPHAGPGYGHHFPLKPGIEVLVAFVEGDPDRPIIAGAVPNPVTPTTVAQGNSIMNRIETASGVYLEIRDI
ncbi:MAG: type VI secretion system tip protein TssI/VgrG [Minicystis sp.]